MRGSSPSPSSAGERAGVRGLLLATIQQPRVVRYRGSVDTNRARGLRKRQTDAERALWRQLRRRNLEGMKFRRQHRAAGFVLDFYCAEVRLAVELDGESHDVRENYDQRRTSWLNAQGVTVLRFPNEAIVLDRDAVVRQIVATAESLRRGE